MTAVQEIDAAAYIRVSTQSDSQLHSFEFQEGYWRDTISRMPSYRLKAIYADRGISGKSINNRTQFLNMIAAAKRGEFRTIFTKSVARFARNTVELLTTVRELKECGVNVIFDSEGIDTTLGDSEMQLTLAAAIAQEQLKTYGENIQWAIRDKFKKGEIVIGRIYGYKLKNGRLEIIENEADVVRLIYSLYLGGMGKQGIANELTSRGIPTLKGRKRWTAETVARMLKNEKYTGHCIMQKSIVMDGVLYREQKIAKRYFMENTHEPIVSQEDWDRTQEIIAQRNEGRVYEQPPDYAFRSKIVCGHCGRGYVHKINNSGTNWAKPMWRCITANQGGLKACTGKAIYDAAIEPLFVEAYNGFVAHKAEYKYDPDLMAKKERQLADERELRVLLAKGMIPLDKYKAENAAILERIKVLDAALKKAAMSDMSGKAAKPIFAFEAEKVKEYLDRAVILDGTVRFEFINGYTITMPYSNGQPGNKKGWSERRVK